MTEARTDQGQGKVTSSASRAATLAALLLTLLSALAASTRAAEPADRNVFFGETHLHTSWSVDAYAVSGSTYNGPEEAYRYARGETINHPLGEVSRVGLGA